MEKKLPKVFTNKTNKIFNNNESIFYSKEEKLDGGNKNSQAIQKNGMNKSTEITKNIYQKINDIFNSERYVYKADVEIKSSKGIIKTKIIGQNKTHLITIDNELIPITDIQDINFVN